MHEELAESKGLRILAFPCNQFGNQVRNLKESVLKYPNEMNDGKICALTFFVINYVKY